MPVCESKRSYRRRSMIVYSNAYWVVRRASYPELRYIRNLYRNTSGLYDVGLCDAYMCRMLQLPLLEIV